MTQFSFSGSPDILPSKKDANDEKRSKELRNLVTPKRLETFFNYLHSLDLWKLSGQKVGIVDIVGTGFGLNSLLRLLDGYYQSCNLIPPKFSFIGMNFAAPLTHLYCDDGTEKWDESQRKVCLYDGKERGSLTFYPLPEKGLKEYVLDAFPLGIPGDVTGALDLPLIQELFSKGVEYLACQWKVLDKGGVDPKKDGPYYQLGMEIFTPIIQALKEGRNLESAINREIFSLVSSQMSDLIRMQKADRDYSKIKKRYEISQRYARQNNPQ
jgi:hypothetical protein